MNAVPVVYKDGMMDMVGSAVLQRLIDTNDIIKFQRSEGWVYPGIDPVRHSRSSFYDGPERRSV